MKHNIALFLLFISQCFYFSVYAQDSMHYTYDDAGNRMARIKVSTRSFTPFLQNIDEEKVNKELLETKVNVYPNPVQSELSITISDLPEKSIWKLLLYDVNGTLIYQKDYNSTQVVLPMTEFLSGEYIVKLIFDQSQSIWKIIKK